LNKFTALLFFSFFLQAGGLYSESLDLCAMKEKEMKNEDGWVSAIRSAISAEQPLAELSVISSSPIIEGKAFQASASALEIAFRRIVERGSQELVPASSLSAAASLVEKKIYNKPRLFILNFRRLQTKICDDKEYRIMIKATLKLQGLKKALLNHGIMRLEFLAKKIRISNVYRATDYFAIRGFLQRRIPNLKRLVEIYQKRGEVQFLIETPVGWDEIRARLTSDPMSGSTSEAGNIPKFQLLYDEKKGLELKLSGVPPAGE
jgi:hypothetical protein